MSPDAILTVQASFAQVAPVADQAAHAFYVRLFERDPGLRSLFRGDLRQQGSRLMAMIGAGVRLLGQPRALVPVLEDLGARHAGYGVREEHYALVGEALIDTLAEGLGSAFTPEVRAAWVAFYDLVARSMQAGAARARRLEAQTARLSAAH